MKTLRIALSALFVSAVFLRPSAEPKPGAPGVSLDGFALKDQGGEERTLASLSDRKAVVLVFLSTQCPISNRYLPELAGILKEYSEQGVSMLGVDSNYNEQQELAAYAKEREIAFPVLRDGDHALADRLGIETVPTVVVLDQKRVVRYRGRVDDDPMGGRPKRRELREALDAVLSGKDVAEPETLPRGCALRRDAPPKDGPVTWAKDVAPIVQQNCVACHRSGQIGPFKLTDYEHASAFAKEIRSAVSEKRMPPWKPSDGLAFLNDRRLTPDQIDTILKWADCGAPMGDASLEPPMPVFKDEWILGPPDLVLEMEAVFDLSGTGPADEYRHFVCRTDLPEDTWVTATEIRPGNPRIVHHVLAYIDTSGTARKLDAAAEGLGYPGEGTWPGFIPTGEMGGWAPGDMPYSLPEGVGRKLKKGADVVLQIHYNRCGTPQKDKTRLGLYFSKTPIKQQIRWAEMVNASFEIPAGAERHEVKAGWSFTKDCTVFVVSPHQHLLGKSAKMVARFPDGKEQTVIEIADWDFKWQDAYMPRTPLKLPAGSKILYTAVYDNSDKNPRNPNRPPKNVYWGEKTSDEMCLGYVGYVEDKEDLTKPRKKKK
ncbi:MAG: redoxin domain-containing protein [Planctomycetota bacterium]